MPGLTADGFERKTLEEILQEIVDDQRATMGAAVVTTPDSVLGQLNGIFAAKVAELWEVAEAIYSSQFVDSASGSALDRLGLLTGAYRLEATQSVAVVRCSGTDGTVLPIGRVVSVDPTGERFVSIEGGTISGGFVDLRFASETFGPVVANAGTLTEIETPVSGWTAATNPEDADIGRNIETDAEFRARRAELLEVSGDATLEAIRSDVRVVPGVEQAIVYENPDDTTNGDGMPPHSIEVVVIGGEDDDIAAAIFASKAAGIDTHGTEAVVVEDSQGFEHTIRFTRPTQLTLELQAVLRLEPGVDEVAAATAVRDAFVARLQDLEIGKTIYISSLYPAAFTVPGVLDVDQLQGRFNPPGGAFTTESLEVTGRQVATLDSSDVNVIWTS